MPASIRVAEFDLWRPGYAGAVVEVLIAGTTDRALLYSDPALTIALPNPQTLQSKAEADGTTYGRFSSTVYVGTAYQLRLNTGEQTGVERPPMLTLAGENASLATATATRGSRSRTLRDHLDARVWLENFGALGSSPTANNAILLAAIGVAAAQGGGEVILPPGNFAYTQFTLPQDVVLVGQGRSATVVRSEQAQAVCTIGGDGAGLRNLTLDGVNLNVGSVGVLSIGRQRVVMDNVIVKRFAQGLLARGGQKMRFRELYVQNCTKGADLRGDLDALGTNTGSLLVDTEWDGGSVEACTTEGLRLSFEDDLVLRSTIRGVRFELNAGPAVVLNGARTTTFESCVWVTNLGNMQVQDDNDLSRVDENTIQQLVVRNSAMVGGTLTFNGLCEDIRFEGCDFSDVDWVLSVPTNPILLEDCTEDSQVTATGALDRLMRDSAFKRGEFPGVTTDASWTTAWRSDLEPGDVVRVRARIIGRRRNGTDWLSGEIVATYFRPGSTMTYALGSATPVVGTVVVGNTSGAEARVIAVSGTTTGTLTLRAIKGAFINGEGLTFSDAKTASSTSTLLGQVATLEAVWWAKDATVPATDAGWDYRASVTGTMAQIDVKGVAGAIVEWLVEVDAVRP